MPVEQRYSQEQLLLDYVARLDAHRQNRYAVHLTLCRLTRLSRHPSNLQRAARIMRTLLQSAEGKLFPLKNNDIEVIVAGATPAEVERRIMQVRMLMREDANLVEAEDEDRDILAVRYALDKDYDRFSDAMTVLVRDVEAAQHSKSSDDADADVDADAAERAKEKQGPPDRSTAATSAAAMHKISVTRGDAVRRPQFSLTDLVRLETALQSVDVEPFITQSPIILLEKSGQVRRIMSERHVSMRRLLQRFMPHTSPEMDVWTAGKARQIASHRHLQLLDGFHAENDLALLVEADLASLSDGPVLGKLAAILPGPLRNRVALSCRMEEVQADPSRYIAGRTRAASAGFLTAITHAAFLPFCMTDWRLLPADFVSVRYSRRLESSLSAVEEARFSENFSHVGAPRLILADCASAQSFETGRSRGFHLFQGPAVTKLISAR